MLHHFSTYHSDTYDERLGGPRVLVGVRVINSLNVLATVTVNPFDAPRVEAALLDAAEAAFRTLTPDAI